MKKTYIRPEVLVALTYQDTILAASPTFDDANGTGSIGLGGDDQGATSSGMAKGHDDWEDEEEW